MTYNSFSLLAHALSPLNPYVPYTTVILVHSSTYLFIAFEQLLMILRIPRCSKIFVDVVLFSYHKWEVVSYFNVQVSSHMDVFSSELRGTMVYQLTTAALKNYPKTLWLKTTHVYCLAVSVNQESQGALAGSPGLRSLTRCC